MIINCSVSKTLLFLLFLITAIFGQKIFCMNNTDTSFVQNYISNSLGSLKNATIPSLTLPLLVVSQLPSAYGYLPGTPAACFIECTANCTDYMPPLCHFSFYAAAGCGVPAILLIGGCAGFCIGIAIKKLLKNNERELLINNKLIEASDD